ncbi:MAG: hypothetical protein GY733_00540 [bacterium]|nr:hypothetical protein [bacterium]
MSLAAKMEQIGARLAEREAGVADQMERVWKRAREIRMRVDAGLEGFRRGAGDLAQLAVTLSEPRLDEKRLHAVQFDVARGRHRVIVTVKSKGVVTLVGPFKDGSQEGPCKRIDLDDDAAIDAGLEEVLAAFLEDAFAP